LSDQGVHQTNPPKRAVHHNAALLAGFRAAGRRSPDAIVVSTYRSARNLGPAFRLGAALGAPVAAMCSHDARPDEVDDVAREAGADVLIFEFPEMKETAFSDLATITTSTGDQINLHGDLGIKRNMGLVAARLAGWRNVLFLDDDISALNPDTVTTAVAGLEHHTAVGMPALQFPDNSAVCHAYRVGGGRPGVFVSGSALAVDVRAADSFFPSVYNEDWLFLAPHLDRRKVASFGEVSQTPYAPFADSQKAEAQEFGDVLAEGLVGYLHSARLNGGPSIDYWETFLDRRAKFISRAREGCAASDDPDARAALRALEAAETARSKISSGQLADYVRAWSHDLARWRRFLVGLPHPAGAGKPIAGRKLPPMTVTSGSTSELLRRARHAGPPGPASFQKILAE
jgi:hypothetical protein